MYKEKKEYKAPIVEVIDYEYTGILCQSPSGDYSGGDAAGMEEESDAYSVP